MSSEMIIRPARIEDSKAVARVQVDSYRSAYIGILPRSYLDHFTYEAQTRDWRDHFDSEHDSILYIAEADGSEIVAYTLARISPCETDPFESELVALHAIPSCQRKGIGRQLMIAASNEIKMRGGRSMMLWVLAQNPSCRLYERLGGRLMGQRRISLGEGDTTVLEVAYGWPDIALTY
jgi:ribosomal protein S18 acetylase RimI-like enzyme